MSIKPAIRRLREDFELNTSLGAFLETLSKRKEGREGGRKRKEGN
jgi:hypothetical protein